MTPALVRYPLVVLAPLLLWLLQTAQGLTQSQQRCNLYGKGQHFLVYLPNSGNSVEKFETFYDVSRNLAVHRNIEETRCYIQKGIQDERPAILKLISKQLTKLQIFKLAGPMTLDFCRGYCTVYVKAKKLKSQRETTPAPSYVDIKLIASPVRKRRRFKDTSARTRRNAGQNSFRPPLRGRYRGQTQSQYLNIGEDPGRAEAESSPDGSRAVVSGKSGMGQAQSQSGFSSGCEGCDTQSQGMALGSGYPSGYSRPIETISQARPGQGGVGKDFYQPPVGIVGRPDVQRPIYPEEHGTYSPKPGTPGYSGNGDHSQRGDIDGTGLKPTEQRLRPGEYSRPGMPIPGTATGQDPGKFTPPGVDKTGAPGSYAPGYPLGSGSYPGQEYAPSRQDQTHYVPGSYQGPNQQGEPRVQIPPIGSDKTGMFLPKEKVTYPGPGGEYRGQDIDSQQPPEQRPHETGKYLPGPDRSQGHGALPQGTNGYHRHGILGGGTYQETHQRPGFLPETGAQQGAYPNRGVVTQGQGAYPPPRLDQVGGAGRFPGGPLDGPRTYPTGPGFDKEGLGTYQGPPIGPPGTYGGHIGAYPVIPGTYPPFSSGQGEHQGGQITYTSETGNQRGPGSYPSGPGYQRESETHPGGPGPHPGDPGSHPGGPGPHPGGPGPHPGGPGPHPGGPGPHPGGTGPLPGGAGPHPAGPGTYPVAPGTYPASPGTYPAGPGPHPGGPGPLPGGPGPHPAGQGSYPVAPGTYPAGPGTYPAGTGTYPAGPGTYPAGPGTYPAGPGTYPAGPGTYPAGPGTYPAGPGTYPAGPGSYPAGPGSYPAGPGSYPAGPGTYPAGPGSYPAGPGTYPAGPRTYPAGPGTYPAGPGTYPAGPGTYPAGPGTYPPGPGTYPAGPGTYPAGPGTYPSGPGTYPAGQGTYPSGPGTYPAGQGTYPAGPGTYPASPGTYPAGPGTYPAGPGTYPAGPGAHPAGPGTHPAGPGTHPADPGTHPAGPGAYPAGPGAYPAGPGAYPSGPGAYPAGPGAYPAGPGTYPAGPGASPAGPGTYPAGPGAYPAGPGAYPAGPGAYPTGPGAYPAGPGAYPASPGSYPASPGSYPAGPGAYPSGPGAYPAGPGAYPAGPGTYPGGPVTYPRPGSHPGTGIPPSATGDTRDYPQGGNIYPTGPYPGQRWPSQGQTDSRGDHVGSKDIGPGQLSYPGAYPPGTRLPTDGGTQYPQGEGGESIYNQQGGLQQGYPKFEDDDANSQAETSIQQSENGTHASVSSVGSQGGGSAQSQISGTYSGSGSFSAQAQTIDANRGAQSQITVNKNGATGSAQGRAGYGQSQAQLQLGSESGATVAEAQSGGRNHGTNTQVQASSKGGLADAQANGPGSTSSQAQIGFQPHQENPTEDVKQKAPFYGGGSASAQSGSYSGQSQTQIQGKFKYGISYTGAAQAGSGSKGGVAQNRTAIKPLDVFAIDNPRTDRKTTNGKDEEVNLDSSVREAMEQSESKTSVQTLKNNSIKTQNPKNDQRHSFTRSDVNNGDDREGKDISNVEDYEDIEEDDYDPDFYPRTEATHQDIQDKSQPREVVIQQTGHGQKQHIVLGPIDKHDVRIVQDSTSKDVLKEGMLFQPGEIVPGTQGYTIPIGYRGRVSSVSQGDETFAFADEHGDSQAQSITLTPGSGNITYGKPVHKTTPQVRSWNSQNSRLRNLPTQNNFNNYNLRSGYNQDNPDSYVTVTKSVTGELNADKTGLAEDKKFSHTYYTKSSTCGYFTFTCNLVYGSNGRTKICKPKPPTNPDGTPVNC